MTRGFLSSALFFLCLLTIGPTALSAHERGEDRREGTSPRTVSVDCTEGESIQRALARYPEADQLVITIHGFCRERVEIHRKVVLRGSSPASDGITGPATLDGQGYLLGIYHVSGIGQTGSDAVSLEHLAVTGSPSRGIAVVGTEVSATDVAVTQNALGGVTIFGGAVFFMDGSVVSDNGGIGLFARAGGRVTCTNCQLNGNVGAQAQADFGSSLTLANAQITGGTGVFLAGGEANLIGGNLATTSRALNVQRGGHLFLADNVQVAGTIVCDAQGLLDSRAGATSPLGLAQTALSNGGNQITNGCVAVAGPGTTSFAGAMTINAASHHRPWRRHAEIRHACLHQRREGQQPGWLFRRQQRARGASSLRPLGTPRHDAPRT